VGNRGQHGAHRDGRGSIHIPRPGELYAPRTILQVACLYFSRLPARAKHKWKRKYGEDVWIVRFVGVRVAYVRLIIVCVPAGRSRG